MQVNFSEPLSFLQRLTEDFEYSSCLDRAALCSDRFEQLAYVAAFAISSYATTTVRTGKPFNPLLGETFECDRLDDLGWRAFTEQVNNCQQLALKTLHVEETDCHSHPHSADCQLTSTNIKSPTNSEPLHQRRAQQ